MSEAPVASPKPLPPNSALPKVALIAGSIVLGLLLVAVILFWLVYAPNQGLVSIIIESDGPWPRDYLLEKMEITADTAYYDLDETAIALSLQELPQVRKTTVQKIFPDMLKVQIETRVPLVQHILSEGTVVLIDAEGVAYDYVQEKTAYDLPVLSGISFRDFSPGTHLPAFLLPFLRDLSSLRKDNPGLFQAFSEFRLDPLGDEEVEVLCFLMDPSVPVRIGQSLTTEAAAYMLRVLAMLRAEKGFSGIRELDFRTRDVIVKKGEV